MMQRFMNFINAEDPMLRRRYYGGGMKISWMLHRFFLSRLADLNPASTPLVPDSEIQMIHRTITYQTNEGHTQLRIS
jgi:hypothetical protein